MKMSKQQAKKYQDEQATSWPPQNKASDTQMKQEISKLTNNKLNAKKLHGQVIQMNQI
jgi:hypothetical protein